jgi:hypothetical protein
MKRKTCTGRGATNRARKPACGGEVIGVSLQHRGRDWRYFGAMSFRLSASLLGFALILSLGCPPTAKDDRDSPADSGVAIATDGGVPGDDGGADAGMASDGGTLPDAGEENPYDGGPAPLCQGATDHNGGDGVCVQIGTCSANFFLRADGRCTAWKETSALPFPVVYAPTVTAAGHVYNLCNSAGDLVSELTGDELAPWTDLPPRNTGAQGCSALADDNRLLALGGADLGGTPAATIEEAILEPDGSPGDWTVLEASLAIPRFMAGAAIEDSTILVVGGVSGAEPLSSIETFSSDIELNPTSTLAGALPDPAFLLNVFPSASGLVVTAGRLSLSAGNIWTWTSGDPTLAVWNEQSGDGVTVSPCIVKVDDELISIGGYVNREGELALPSDGVDVATVGPDLSITPWRRVGVLDFGRIPAGCAVVGDYLIVVGGQVLSTASTIDGTSAVSIASIESVQRSVEAP